MGQACPHPAVPPVQPPSGHSVTVYLPRGGRGSPLRAGLRRPPHPPAPGTPGRSPPPPRSHRRPGPTAGLRPAAGPEEAPGASGERPRKAAAGDAAHLNGTPPLPAREPRPVPPPPPPTAVTSQLNSISASMVAMRTVKVLGCFLFSELKLMRDAMAPAMAGGGGSARRQRHGGGEGPGPRRSGPRRAAPRPRRPAIGPAPA